MATRDPIRVMVVDDSAFMRKMLSEILAAAPGIEVVGTARDGEDALAKLETQCPDVLTLDVEMPRMDGLVFLEALMQRQPVPVVIVSKLTAEGAEVTLACLQRGAVDFVLKPSGAISLNIATIGEEIIAKVRAAAGSRVQHPSALALARGLRSRRPPIAPLGSLSSHPPYSAQSLAVSDATRNRQDSVLQRLAPDTIIVAIASSTGGPAALHEVLPRLPADLNAAYVVVQHLPPHFTRSLAERMDHASHLTVREAQAGDLLLRGMVLIAPGGHHLELNAQGQVVLNDDPPLWGVRPAADVMMRSVTACFGKRVIGVVLTGMGCDGALGIKAIHEAGGACLAQDEATCVVYGMPRAAAETGCVDRVVALPEMAAAIAHQILARGQAAQGPSGTFRITRRTAA